MKTTMVDRKDFPKYERICKDSDIQTLFRDGQGFSSYPYRVVFCIRPSVDAPVTCRLLLSVSKKRFHHAFKRNRVKRLIRESWRQNKSALYDVCCRGNVSMDVALIYTATVIHSYDEMFAKTRKSINLIIKMYEAHKSTSV